MFEKFTDCARKVMVQAHQEARSLRHEYIGTEHILLGLIHEGTGVGAQALQNLGVDLGKVRRQVEMLLRPGPDMATMGKLPQTPRARKVIEYAIDEARALRHSWVDSGHLLLGLQREQEGVAAQVLLNFGLQPDKVREEVCRLLDTGEFQDPGEDVAAPPGLLEELERLVAIERQNLGGQQYLPEHFLLALFHEPTGRIRHLLASAGIEPDALYATLREAAKKLPAV